MLVTFLSFVLSVGSGLCRNLDHPRRPQVDTGLLPTSSARRTLILSVNAPIIRLQLHTNTTRIFLYETCTNATATNTTICSRNVQTIFAMGNETFWRVPVEKTLRPIYITMTSDRDLAAPPSTTALHVSTPEWTVSAVSEVVRDRQYIFRVDPVPFSQPRNVTFQVPTSTLLPKGANYTLAEDGNGASNELFAYFDASPPVPVIRTVRQSPLIYQSTVLVELDYGEPLLENCLGGTCLFEVVGQDNATVRTLSSYDPDIGLVTLELKPKGTQKFTIRSKAQSVHDISNNTVTQVAQVEFFHAERPPALNDAIGALSYAAGAGVEAATLMAFISPMLCERHVTRHADSAINSAIKLAAWAQVFTMTSFLQVPALSEEYRSLAIRFDWSMLNIHVPWTQLSKTQDSSSVVVGSNRRRLLDPSTFGNSTSIDPTAWAEMQQGKMIDDQLAIDIYEQAQLYGYSVAFIGGTIFGLHLVYLIIASILHLRVPSILLFPRIELYLVLFVLPIVGFLAGAVLARGDVITVLVVFLVYPAPLLLGCSYLLIKVLLLPHPNIRRIFYEVQYNERALSRIKASRMRMPWYRRLLRGFTRVPAEWKTIPGDDQAADMLSRFLPLLGGLRGPAAVRMGDSYSVNPWTLRIKRGFFEPIKDTSEAENATGLARLKYHLKSAGYLFSSFGIIWNVAKTFVMAVLLGYFRAGGGRQQTSILLAFAAAHSAWLLFIRPAEDGSVGRRDLFSSLIETAGFAIALVLAARGHQGPENGGLTYQQCLALSRAMLGLFLGAIVLYLGTMLLDIIRTAAAALDGIRNASRERFTKAGRAAIQAAGIKKYANRWMCRALRRPLTGWPKVSRLSYMERKLVEVLLATYPGHRHRNLKRENTWDSLGVWLLGSCPPPDILLDLIEQAAETSAIWREWLSNCTSREQALEKLIELLQSSIGIPDYAAMPQVDIYTRDLVPVETAIVGVSMGRKSGEEDLKKSLVPVGSQSLYVPGPTGASPPKTSPNAVAPAPSGITQSVSIRAGSNVSSAHLQPIEEEPPAPALTLNLPTFNANKWKKGQGNATAMGTDSAVRERPPSTASASMEPDSSLPSPMAGSRPESRTGPSRSMHHSGFLSAFLHMMGIDAPNNPSPPPKTSKPPTPPAREMDPMLQEVPHVVDARYIDEPSVAQQSGAGGSMEEIEPAPAPGPEGNLSRTQSRYEPQEETGGTFMWFLGSKGKKKGKGKKKEKKNKGKFWVDGPQDVEANPNVDARGSGGVRPTQIVPITADSPPIPPPEEVALSVEQEARGSNPLAEAIADLDSGTQSAVIALLDAVGQGVDVDTTCHFDEVTGMFILDWNETSYFVHGSVIEIVIREAERLSSQRAQGEMLRPVDPAIYISPPRQRKGPVSGGGLPAPEAIAAVAEAARSRGGTVGSNAGTVGSASGTTRGSRGASVRTPWSFFWGDKRDTVKGKTHKREATQDEIVLEDDRPHRGMSPQPRLSREPLESGAWTADRQVPVDLESAILMKQKLRQLAHAAQNRRGF